MLEESQLELILNDWNYWNSPFPSSISRKALMKIPRLPKDLVLVIQGVRRCGKSTLLSQIIQSLQLNPLDCTMVNFEDPRLSSDLNPQLLDMIVEQRRKERPKAPHYYFFLDEIQNVAEWEKWLHLKTARPKNESYVITGSNASLLSGELSTALTGRHLTLELFPFDFQEYKLQRLQGTIESYLEEGGFPRALTYEDPQELLREYFTDIIERDVRRHVSARSTVPLFQLVKAVFESTGSEVSQRSLAGMLGVTADTVGSYLDACESAYLLLRCPYFTYSERQRTARNRKYYPIDLGMRNAVVTKPGIDRGKKLETIVFHHLRKQNQEVCFWRGKGEVDFVVNTQNGITPYQISWDGPKERHDRALKEFYAEFPQANPVVFVSRSTMEAFFSQLESH